MKIGVISDIHSNVIAFREAMDTMLSRGCEEFLFLGDYVSDTPYTRETMDEIYCLRKQYPCWFLRGNREEYLLNQKKIREGTLSGEKWLFNSASGNLLFTYERLTEEDFSFFESLPVTFCYEKEGYPRITCCHGSPINTRELMQLGAENSVCYLSQIDTDYLIAAHTHYPGQFMFNGKTHLNPGCCGIAIYDYGYAQCMILESVKSKWVPTFLKVPYDREAVIEEMIRGGLYQSAPWFINANIHILKTGIDKCAQMVVRALEIEKERNNGEALWPHISEEAFEEASKELEIPAYL